MKLTVNAEGKASAKANHGSWITLTGTGTFLVNCGNGHPHAVTGGGMLAAFDEQGVSTASALKGPSCEKRFAAHDERQGNNQNQMPGEALINQTKPGIQSKERYKMKSNSSIPASIMAVLARTLTRRGFLICALFSLATVASTGSAVAGQPIPVSIYQTYNKLATPNPGFSSSWVGVATLVIGTDFLIDPTSTMDVIATGDITHCTYTFTIPDQGTLVLAAVCWSGGHGAWHVAKGTGVFEHFEGIGTQEFGPLPAGQAFTNFERFAGTGTFKKHGDDKHGDDKHGDDKHGDD